VEEAMRKIIGVSLAVLLLLLLVGQLRAEDYVSKDFPQDEVLMRNIQDLCNSFKILKILGKYQDKDEVYHVITMVDSQGASKMHLTTVIRLDTNLWVVNPARCNDGVMQK
jgi:hypothetical protein